MMDFLEKSAVVHNLSALLPGQEGMTLHIYSQAFIVWQPFC